MTLSITTYKSKYKNPLNKILQEHKNANCYYTDASKTENGVGLAITNEDFITKFKLSESYSIYTAEAIAILKMVKYVIHNHDRMETSIKAI